MCYMLRETEKVSEQNCECAQCVCGVGINLPSIGGILHAGASGDHMSSRQPQKGISDEANPDKWH